MAGYVEAEDPGYGKILKELGKHKASAGCVYVNKLEDVNIDKLKELIRISVEFLKKKHSS